MTNHRAEDLDLERLGSMLVSIPLTSDGLRHTSLQASLDYMHTAEENLELEYVRDILTLDTQAIIDKWFGGEEVAGRARAELLDQVIMSLRAG